jgi:hypothetical protein
MAGHTDYVINDAALDYETVQILGVIWSADGTDSAFADPRRGHEQGRRRTKPAIGPGYRG